MGGGAEERVNRIKTDISNPSRDVIIGLEKILGKSGMLSYLSYMTERLVECKRLLKNTGSIYLHCNSTASHYLKIIMDAVFGNKYFRNEIIWHHPKPGVAKRKFTSNTDTILFYTMSNNYPFVVQRSEKQPNELFNRWKNKIRNNKLYYKEAKNIKDSPAQSKINVLKKKLNRELKDNDIIVDFDMPENKKTVDNVWKISFLKGNFTESVGYPTQKPLAILEKIINASTNEGDLVLDPFCGCGTTVHAANKLNRKWVGIDISSYAVNTVMRNRLKKAGVECRIKGMPTDLASAKYLAKEKPFLFERWAVTQIPGAVPNERQIWDRGIDGKALIHGKKEIKGFNNNEMLFQVKGGGINISQVRDFCHVIKREKAVCGVFIVLEKKMISNGMKRELEEMGTFKIGATSFPRSQFWTIEEFFGSKIKRPYIPALAIPTDVKKVAYEFGDRPFNKY